MRNHLEKLLRSPHLGGLCFRELEEGPCRLLVEPGPFWGVWNGRELQKGSLGADLGPRVLSVVTH